MRVIVGLGNPGEKYKNNRHNIGFRVVERLAKKKWSKSKAGHLAYSWLSPQIELVKPLTFMNESGNAVSYIVKKHKAANDNLFVVHDDLDLKLGTFKIQKGKGPREHKGLLSIYQVLGTKDFWHVRIGADKRSAEHRIPGDDYVLQDFRGEEKVQVDEVVERVVERLKNEALKIFPNI